jgi:hypothetical protein
MLTQSASVPAQPADQSGAPAGWTWRLADEKPDRVRRRGRKTKEEKSDWLMWSFRVPPAPYRERPYALGPGFCCICGQPVYRFGWHVDLWGRGANRNAVWHAACVIAWDLWTGPSDYARVLKRLQQRRCAQSGGRLWKTAEVDHRVPLFRVWREHRHTQWPSLLGFWGVPNLRVINRDVHLVKCAEEAHGPVTWPRTVPGGRPIPDTRSAWRVGREQPGARVPRDERRRCS